jgi:hypothetical protein
MQSRRGRKAPEGVSCSHRWGVPHAREATMRAIRTVVLLACALPLLAGCARLTGPVGSHGSKDAAMTVSLPPLDRQEPPEVTSPEAVIAAAGKPGAWLRLRSVGPDEAGSTVAEVDVVEAGRVTSACVLTLRRGPRMRAGYATQNPARLARGVRVGEPVRLVRKGGATVVLPPRRKRR